MYTSNNINGIETILRNTFKKNCIYLVKIKVLQLAKTTDVEDQMYLDTTLKKVAEAGYGGICL